MLNSISSDTDVAAVGYFNHDMNDCVDFKEKIDLLLTWSVTPLQYGDHRPFAAATLVRTWRDKACDRATRRNVANPSDFLQDQLFDWLDTSEVAGEASNIREVALLYGKLVKYDVFSYASYIQRLVARGEVGLSYAEVLHSGPFLISADIFVLQDVGSRHRLLLNWIPLGNSTLSLTNQRKVTLYGARARETPEDVVERDMRKEIRTVLPNLFEGLIYSRSFFESNLTRSKVLHSVHCRRLPHYLRSVKP
jgi:mediator of RNA polymerase II transcription subunit 12